MGDDALVDAIKTDYRRAELDARTRAILDFAVEITDDPHSSSQQRVDQLRAAGLTDQDVLDTVQVAGFFNYYNLMADALGVALEDFMPSRG